MLTTKKVNENFKRNMKDCEDMKFKIQNFYYKTCLFLSRAHYLAWLKMILILH